MEAAVEGVKKLYNDILVIEAIDKKKGAVEGFIDDTVIESKINALLLDAGGVNVTNFRWRSVGGRVYPFGRALSKPELNEGHRHRQGHHQGRQSRQGAVQKLTDDGGWGGIRTHEER